MKLLSGFKVAEDSCAAVWTSFSGANPQLEVK
jgi:hypothetical protein